ncbi:MAG: hypothetical protein ACOYOU_14400 [Kiritimatiellia bacterium]
MAPTTQSAAQIATGCGVLGDTNLTPLAYGGHAYYVRKCVIGEQAGKDFWVRQLNGIVLPDRVAMNGGLVDFMENPEAALIVEIIGRGPNVGRRCSKKHADLYKRARWFSEGASVGDYLLVPAENPGNKRSPLCDDEYFVEESVPLAIYPNEQQKVAV